MVKVGKCALIALNAQKVDVTRSTDEKKLATVRVGIFFENAD